LELKTAIRSEESTIENQESKKADCLVFPFESAEGAANMALDEALLNAVAGGGEVALLRTYGWSEPTLSLGYFQHVAEAQADSRWRSVPTVRRFSGGGALWHHHEVTYALAVPASHPLARPSTKLYQAVHATIRDTLRSRGVSAFRRGDLATSEKSERKRAFLCFTGTDPEDIVTDGVKIVGSAQRRREGAVLQHGSLLLARSFRTPELPGVCDVAACTAAPMTWSEWLCEQIPGALGLRPHAVAIPEELRLRAKEWKQNRYDDPRWTLMR
jgi:lipoyl(octanoyl) transferase